jgi:hypothetical protein
MPSCDSLWHPYSRAQAREHLGEITDEIVFGLSVIDDHDPAP